MIAKDIEQIRNLLIAESSVSSQEWWSNYVKESSPFLGTPTSAVRRVVNRFVDRGDASAEALDSAMQLALSLIEQEYSEEKIAGMLIIKEYVIPKSDGRPSFLTPERMASLFDGGFIRDWNVCDWFCMRVSGPMIRAHGDSMGYPILDWASSFNLWRARASIVSFIPVIETTAYRESILAAAKILNRRSERFAKTGVGWVLREMSKHDPASVTAYVEDDLSQFSFESLRNATKYFDGPGRKSLINRFRILGNQ
jgi:3-methyladenine DNA glycosylase AlkD